MGKFLGLFKPVSCPCQVELRKPPQLRPSMTLPSPGAIKSDPPAALPPALEHQCLLPTWNSGTSRPLAGPFCSAFFS